MDQRFIDLLAPSLPLLGDRSVTEDARLRELGMDSMEAVDLLVRLEEAFEVSLPDEDLDETTFDTAGTLWKAVRTAMDRKDARSRVQPEPPEPPRSPLRRLRGRLTAPVTLWTATRSDGGRAGLTIAPTMVADGEPGMLLGLIDTAADLAGAVRSSGRFTVQVLGRTHQRLADQFAGVVPAPGGPFGDGQWRGTRWGPVLDCPISWAGCRLDDARAVGWRLLVEATVEHIELAEDAAPLLYHRGRYRTLTPTSP